MRALLNYFSDSNHCKLYSPYSEGHFKNEHYLLFTKDWMAENLPPQWEYNKNNSKIRVVLLDTTNGKKYETKKFACYEQYDFFTVLDKDFNELKLDLYSLQNYFYSEHYCACHRKTDAKWAGAITDEECEGERFLIERISPLNSDFILMSEVYSEDELIGYL